MATKKAGKKGTKKAIKGGKKSSGTKRPAKKR